MTAVTTQPAPPSLPPPRSLSFHGGTALVWLHRTSSSHPGLRPGQPALAELADGPAEMANNLAQKV